MRQPCCHPSLQSGWPVLHSVQTRRMSCWLRNHLNGVTRAMLEADSTPGAFTVVIAIPPSGSQLDDRILRAGCIASVTFKAVAAGKAALRLTARFLFGQTGNHLLESSHTCGNAQCPLRGRISVAVNRQM